jgi:ketosteroid isomerase-like protein
MRRLLIAVLALVAVLAAGPAGADDVTDEARAALVAYTEATLAGPEALAPMLAPEFQIMRANGVGYDRNGYLRTVHTVSAAPDFSHEDIVATVHDGVMVVRYFLRIDETIDGKPVARRAPRLTVFRKLGGQWKVVSHANFGATE